MKGNLARRCTAEFLGTFALVFFGCGSIATVGSRDTGPLTVNLVFGLIVAAMIYALGHISAAHFNPAVTLGFAVARRFPWRDVLPYWTAEFGGALLASGLHHFLIADRASVVRYGATLPSVPSAAAVGLEALLTFFFLFVIIAVATDRRVPAAMPGLAIGMTVALCGLFGGPLTGCSMNPARSLAPAVFAGGAALSALWIFFVGPALGAVLGALTYEALRNDAGETSLPVVPCSQEQS